MTTRRTRRERIVVVLSTGAFLDSWRLELGVVDSGPPFEVVPGGRYTLARILQTEEGEERGDCR
ncbi:hypothetical protein PFISCL1PPCAC_42, partial [Pristionchus fissidentatus]